jgi:membrane protein
MDEDLAGDRADHEPVTSPPTSNVVLDAVPRRLRPLAAAVLANRVGGVLLRVTGELIRVQIFDRAMTLAAQVFTSVFPLLIMLGALFGERVRTWIKARLDLPPATERLLEETLGGSHSNTFGVLGSLVVIISATGLARALLRAYRIIWMAPPARGGAAATVRQVAAVLLLAMFVVAIRLLGSLAGRLPVPHLASAAVMLPADVAVATGIPLLLLGPAVARHRLLVAGAVFGALMIAVRAAGSIYLPRALESSSRHYGTIGLAFTYIGWLYVLSFVLLLSAILGRVLTAGPAPSHDASFTPTG